MYPGWRNSAVTNRDCRKWPWWCCKGECSCRYLQTQWGCRGEGGFRQANKSLFFVTLTSGNCRGCSLSENHLLPFFLHISSKWGHGWEVPNVIFQSLIFLIWKMYYIFLKRKKKRERDKERRLCLEPKIKNLKAFLVKWVRSDLHRHIYWLQNTILFFRRNKWHKGCVYLRKLFTLP